MTSTNSVDTAIADGRLVDRPDPGKDVSNTLLGWLTVLTMALVAVLGLYVVHAAVPTDIISLPAESRTAIRQFVPEGWQFFAEDPQTVSFPQAYTRSGDEWVWNGGSQAEPQTLFGLDRSRQAQLAEILLLLEKVPQKALRPCTTTPSECLNAAPVAATLTNTSPVRTVCGEAGLVTQQATPWNLRSADRPMPSTIVKVWVRC